MLTHDIDCDLDEDCSCAAGSLACAYYAGSGEAYDPLTLSPGADPSVVEFAPHPCFIGRCPECGGTGLRSRGDA